MLSIILPASNEERLIGPCLTALLASDDPGCAVELLVVANGCEDQTAVRAEAYIDRARRKGWAMQVVDLPEGGKIRALNAGDALARYPMRAYLDADVTVSPKLLQQMCGILARDSATYTSGRVQIAPPKSAFSRAYATFYRQVPFMCDGVAGCGLFAVNGAGRKRWGVFPDIISDDTYVRLLFAPDERIGAAAPYVWPIVEGFDNLVRVRRRQDAGVAEVQRRYPELMKNDDKVRMGAGRLLGLMLRHPIGFIAYGAVALAVHKSVAEPDGVWSRGR